MALRLLRDMFLAVREPAKVNMVTWLDDVPGGAELLNRIYHLYLILLQIPHEYEARLNMDLTRSM